MQSTDQRKNNPPTFRPFVVGQAEFATGAKFRIIQIKKNGACRIEDLNKIGGEGQSTGVSHSHSIANAWANVRYQAMIRQDTENTHGWKGP